MSDQNKIMTVMDNLYVLNNQSHYVHKKNIFAYPKYCEDVICKKRPRQITPSKIFLQNLCVLLFFFGMFLIMVVSLKLLNSEFSKIFVAPREHGFFFFQVKMFTGSLSVLLTSTSLKIRATEVVPRRSRIRVAEWSITQNRVKLNSDKCMELRTSFAENKPQFALIVVYGNELERVTSAKLLGLIVSSKHGTNTLVT